MSDLATLPIKRDPGVEVLRAAHEDLHRVVCIPVPPLWARSTASRAAWLVEHAPRRLALKTKRSPASPAALTRARVSGCIDAHPGVGRCVLAVAHHHAERPAVVAVEHLSEHCALIVKRHAMLHPVKG